MTKLPANNDDYEDMTTAAKETFTPVQLRKIIAERAPNRPFKKTEIAKIRRDMENKRFHGLNGETLKFLRPDASGIERLADGQNRAEAAQQANVSLTTWVIRGITLLDRDTAGKGSRKTLSDTFRMHGWAYAQALGAATGWYRRLVVRANPDLVPRQEHYPTELEAEQLLRETALPDSVERIAQWHATESVKVGLTGLFAALHCLFSEAHGKHMADEFFEKTIRGIDLAGDSGPYALRNRLIDPKARYTAVEMAAITIKAYVAYRTNRLVLSLRWARKGKNAEVFPNWR